MVHCCQLIDYMALLSMHLLRGPTAHEDQPCGKCHASGPLPFWSAPLAAPSADGLAAANGAVCVVAAIAPPSSSQRFRSLTSRACDARCFCAQCQANMPPTATSAPKMPILGRAI